MSCCCAGWKGILIQALAIVLVGGMIGYADSEIRPVKLSRTAVPPPPGPGGETIAIAQGPTGSNPGGQGQTPPPPGPKQPALPPGHITLDAAKALFDKQATFIDARKASDYIAGHVKGAYRMAEEDFRFGNPPMLAAIPRDATLVVYCKGGDCDESEQVAKLIEGSGYTKVYVMHDGLPGWDGKGWPVEKGE